MVLPSSSNYGENLMNLTDIFMRSSIFVWIWEQTYMVGWSSTVQGRESHHIRIYIRIIYIRSILEFYIFLKHLTFVVIHCISCHNLSSNFISEIAISNSFKTSKIKNFLPGPTLVVHFWDSCTLK